MEVSPPNWADDVDYSAYDAIMLEDLEGLRLTRPILHTMVMGIKTVPSMARRIGWPHDHIIWQLREYKGEGLVADREGRRAVEWYITIGAPEDLWDLAEWCRRQRQAGGLFMPKDSRQAD
jgi:hypothetical protein